MARTVKLLQLYSASPDDLIYNYYAERFRHQLEQQHPNGNETSVYPIGSINIRAIVHETHLRVEILNARHLKPLETQKGQKAENLPSKTSSGNTLLIQNNGGKSRGTNFATCLSAPDESLTNLTTVQEFSNNTTKSENQINEVSGSFLLFFSDI